MYAAGVNAGIRAPVCGIVIAPLVTKAASKNDSAIYFRLSAGKRRHDEN